MCVCGLDMQVSTYQAIPQVDPLIEEGDFFGEPWDYEFDGGVVTVETFNEDS